MMDQQSEYKVKAPKKLIEVALPLKEINEACVREKSIRHGHPSPCISIGQGVLWLLPGVLFAQLVNDPGWDEELQIGYKRKADANRKREELFEIIRELVKWENTNNEVVLEKARTEIRKSWKVTCELNKDHPQAAELFNPDKLPAFHDPFAGGGSIPLEAQRLGLEAWASDLNPVAVLINKAMIEIPPKFVGHRPIGPIPECDKQTTTNNYSWPGVTGLAEDVRRWGHWVREEAYKRIGHLYPPIEITKEMVAERPDLASYKGKKLTVIAYIWARTVKSPNPQFSHVDVPLATTFILSSKPEQEAYVEPYFDGVRVLYKVKTGKCGFYKRAKNGTKLNRGASFQCWASNTPITKEYIYQKFRNKEAGASLIAIILQGDKSRLYITPDPDQEILAKEAFPGWVPRLEMEQKSRDLLSGRGYGIKFWHELFSNRQLVALTTNSELIRDIFLDNPQVQKQSSYDSVIRLFLAFTLDKCADYWSSICSWHNSKALIRNTFGRQAIPMVWDYAEVNPFSDSTGNWLSMLDWVVKALLNCSCYNNGHVELANAYSQNISKNKVISTDPPYYDNISYAELSDFFYIWLRYIIANDYPSLFETVLAPKEQELISLRYRHSDLKSAEKYFLDGMQQTMRLLSSVSNNAYPMTIYYAYKQSDSTEAGNASTGWVTFLAAVINSDLAIMGTWPMRTELANKVSAVSSNMLASSIILVCRNRNADAESVSRKDFLRELNQAIPEALNTMINGSETSSPIAPVDLAQAAIGPGMAVFSKYKAILESDGSPMSVHTALILINKAIDDYFKELEGDWDSESRFCLQWFSEYGWREGAYGEAEVLAKAKGLSVEGVRDSGVLAASGGRVQLLRPSEYPDVWDPTKDSRMPVWEVLHHLIRLLQTRGESAAAEIVKAIPHISETARQLAFLLYTTCERKGWAEDARPYNDLVTAWLSIEKQARADDQDMQIEAEF